MTITFTIQLLPLSSLFLLLHLCLSSPILAPSDYNSTDHVQPAIDCTLTNSAVPTRLDGIQAGLKVLQKHCRYIAYSNTQQLFSALFPHGACYSTVSYSGAKTLGLTPTDANIARWYTVFASFQEYITTLDANDDTLEILLDAVNKEFLLVLQDLRCNCSEGCRIEEPRHTPLPSSCLSPLTHTQFILAGDVIPQAAATVRQYREVCSCTVQGEDPVTPLEWFNGHYPMESPDREAVRQLLTPLRY